MIKFTLKLKDVPPMSYFKKAVMPDDETAEVAKIIVANLLRGGKIPKNAWSVTVEIGVELATCEKWDGILPERAAAPFYAIRNQGQKVFVKEGNFFREQGGLDKEWGESWQPIQATSLGEAREIAEKTLPEFQDARISES